MAKINYQKVGWDTTKFFNPTNMNQMDQGIKAACDKADKNESDISELNTNKAPIEHDPLNGIYLKDNNIDLKLDDVITNTTIFGHSNKLELKCGYLVTVITASAFENQSYVSQFAIGNIGIAVRVKNNGIWSNWLFPYVPEQADIVNVIIPSANNACIINDNLISGSAQAPDGKSEYIPLVVGIGNTNNCMNDIRYEGGKWRIIGTVAQRVSIKFYKIN